MRTSFLLLAFAALVACACASRTAPDTLIGNLHSDGFPAGLKAIQSNMQALFGRSGLNLGRREEDEKCERRAYMAMRFTVPPAEATNFEKAWLALEEQVRKEEDVEVFNLKKTKMDNLFYISYGEFGCNREMRKHMSSKHFTEFAEFVDDHDVRWEVQLLENESLDIEEGRRGRGGRNDEVSQAGKLWSRKDLAHVLIQYSVPPGNSKEFIDAWTDLAERTIEEKGNRMYSLRRVATDNTHFYAYGTWTSMGDYMDHFESKHLGKFLDDVEDKNIIYFLDPLEEICEE